MAADPLKEVLQKVVKERQDQIDTLTAQLQTTFDPIAREDIEKQITQLYAELNAAFQALNQPATPAPAPAQPAPVEQPRVTPDPQLLGSEAVAPAPKGPSKAALEAQIRELQTQLLDAARVVEKSGPTPNALEVAHLTDIRNKLNTAMQQIGEADSQLDVGDLPPKPAPAQLIEADNLIKRSMLEKRRGNNQAASDLLRKAAEIAPGAPAVLEALGDDMMERGQAKPAAETYAKALRIQSNNASIERKYAMAIAKSKGAVTLEEAMQMSLGDSPLSTAEAANVKAAGIFSFFIPGSGQIILGDYIKGAIYMALWLGMIVWLKAMRTETTNLLDSIVGKKSGFSPVVLVPIIGMVIIQLVAAFTVKQSGGAANVGTLRKAKGSHPAPPVDLPFE